MVQLSALLFEVAANTETFSANNIGLLMETTSEDIAIVLIDLSFIDETILSNEINSDLYVGTISLRKLEQCQTQVYETHTVAAKKGYGPLLYQLGMSVVDSICSDRDSVSTKAFVVWRRFYEDPGVIKQLLPEECHYRGTETEYGKVLNNSYSTSNKIDVRGLLANTQKDLSSLLTDLSTREVKIIQNRILNNRAAFFKKKI